jgi:hypothetical protein
MAEREIHWPYKACYSFEVEEVRLDLYRLLNQFVAEEKLSGLMEEDGWLFHAVDIVGHFFDVELQRILIHAAVVARVKDDNEEESLLRLSNYETTCGVLIEDLRKPNDIASLNLREACNKIIHALRFHYDTEEQPRRIINPTIYLYGKRNSKNWKATIQVIDFIKHYINNVV